MATAVIKRLQTTPLKPARSTAVWPQAWTLWLLSVKTVVPVWQVQP
jgi:hypothetical protein